MEVTTPSTLIARKSFLIPSRLKKKIMNPKIMKKPTNLTYVNSKTLESPNKSFTITKSKTSS